ncbi:hypothetical protein ILYODFUR_009747 [Ilyodon furcidens]|uniref:Uncharacterized protein n=1 Tax=Ilyodon furcidens TaxID=33524 RepID=A0ABV0UER9_9TELE
MVKRLYNPKTIWQRWRRANISSSSLRCMRVCVCVRARVSSAPAGFANATVWVTLQQFAPHLLIFFGGGSLNVISSVAASLHMGSFHPAVVFITAAAFLFVLNVLFLWLCLTTLNCCSPG